MNIVIFGSEGDIGNTIYDKLSAQGNHDIMCVDLVDSKKDNFTKCNLSIEQDVIKLFGKLSTQNIEVIINAAGVILFKKIIDTTKEDWDMCLESNLTVPFLINKHTALQLKSNIRIIHLSSIADHNFLEGNSAYASSKVGLKAMSEVFNKENYRSGLFSTVISLGAVSTSAWDDTAFDRSDMLQTADVADVISLLLKMPKHIRIDDFKLMPPKGVL